MMVFLNMFRNLEKFKMSYYTNYKRKWNPGEMAYMIKLGTDIQEVKIISQNNFLVIYSKYDYHEDETTLEELFESVEEAKSVLNPQFSHKFIRFNETD